jgi:hypothetical protein
MRSPLLSTSFLLAFVLAASLACKKTEGDDTNAKDDTETDADADADADTDTDADADGDSDADADADADADTDSDADLNILAFDKRCESTRWTYGATSLNIITGMTLEIHAGRGATAWDETHSLRTMGEDKKTGIERWSALLAIESDAGAYNADRNTLYTCAQEADMTWQLTATYRDGFVECVVTGADPSVFTGSCREI